MKMSSTEGTIKRLKNQTVNATLTEGIQVPIKFHWTSPSWQELLLNYNAITYYSHDQLISTRLLLHVFREKQMSYWYFCERFVFPCMLVPLYATKPDTWTVSDLSSTSLLQHDYAKMDFSESLNFSSSLSMCC